MRGEEPRRARPARPLTAAIVMALAAVASSVDLSGSRPAQAQPQPDRGSQTGGGAGTVEITVVGTADDLRRIRGVVESRSLAGPGARWSRVPGFDPRDILHGERESKNTALRCWIDVLDPRRARLYFAARSGQQFLVRDVELGGTFAAVDRETLSQVIELSVSALLENERAGLTRAQAEAVLASRDAEVPRPPAAPAAPAATSPPPAVVEAPPPPEPIEPIEQGPPRSFGTGPAAAVFYRARVLGAGLPVVHGPGALLSWAGLGERRALGVWASGQYDFPQQEVGPAIGLRFETVAVRGGVEAHLPLGRAGTGGDTVGQGPAFVGLTGRFGAGVDLVRLTPRSGSADPSAVLTPVRWTRSFVVAVALSGTWTVSRLVALGVTASLDVLPTVVHYDLDVAGRTSTAFSPWRVRPGLALELSWH